MAQVEATTERVVAADAEKVFDALADYSGTRAKLLPEQFSEYEVREGATARAPSSTGSSRPPASGSATASWRSASPPTASSSRRTATPRWSPPGGSPRPHEGKSRVVVTTVWNGAGGIGGFFEKTFAPKGLGRIYDAVLARLATEVEK